jgi:HEAT repeat protein
MSTPRRLPGALAWIALAAVLAFNACQSSQPPPPAQPAAKAAPALPPPEQATLDQLRAMLQEPDVQRRIQVCDELGRRAATSREAADVIVVALTDKEPLVRRFAASAMANVQAPTVVQVRALSALLSDAETDPRESASRALVTLGPRLPPEAVPETASALAAAVPDTQESVRRNVLEALGAIGPRATEVPAVKVAVERALSDGAESTRSAAVATLGAWGTPDTVPLLKKALGDPSHEVRKQAVVALEKMGPKAAPASSAIAQLLTGKELYLRVFAADALAAIGPGAKAALPALKAAAKKAPKDIQGSPEIEAQQLPEAIDKAIAAIEGKPAKKKR